MGLYTTRLLLDGVVYHRQLLAGVVDHGQLLELLLTKLGLYTELLLAGLGMYTKWMGLYARTCYWLGTSFTSLRLGLYATDSC